MCCSRVLKHFRFFFLLSGFYVDFFEITRNRRERERTGCFKGDLDLNCKISAILHQWE